MAANGECSKTLHRHASSHPVSSVIVGKPGGRLDLCHMFRSTEEIEDQIGEFLSRAERLIGFRSKHYGKIIGGTCPSRGDHLHLTPA